MADPTDPTWIQAPRLVQEDGHDLPVSPGRPTIHYNLQEVLEASPLGSDHALVKDRLKNPPFFTPIHPREPLNPRTDTYFGATLMALFNVSPFLNFLEEAAATSAFIDPLIKGLHGLAKSFRNWDPNNLTDEHRRDALESQMKTIFRNMHTSRASWPQPFSCGAGSMRVLAFIDFLFVRLAKANLRESHVDGDEVNLSIRFKQLFKFFYVRHTPMRCPPGGCPQPVLRRQPTKDGGQLPGYLLLVEVPKSMNLDEAISRAMWEKLAAARTCPDCWNTTGRVHEFDKFAYLPEVLIMGLIFLDKSGGIGNYKFPTDAKITYPEQLDMSALRDDPTRPGDQTDCTYTLRSVIHTNDTKLKERGPIFAEPWLYKAAIRLSDQEFAQFDYYGPRKATMDYVTFEDVNEAKNGFPHVLMYVRDHHGAAGGNADKLKSREVTEPKPEAKQDVDTSHSSEDFEDTYDVQRFVDGQDTLLLGYPVIRLVRIAFESGQKVKFSDNMWCMFPRVSWSDDTDDGETYADPETINSLDEARDYWDDSSLRDRYTDLVEVILLVHSRENNREGAEYPYSGDINQAFESPDDVQRFIASVTLFIVLATEAQDMTTTRLLDSVICTFGLKYDRDTGDRISAWYRDAADEKRAKDVLTFLRLDQADEQPADPARAIACAASPEPTGDASAETNRDARPARRICSELLNLAEEELADDSSQYAADHSLDDAARALGEAVLGFGQPKGTAATAATPEEKERARRLGRHLLRLAETAVSSTDDSSSGPNEGPSETDSNYEAVDDTTHAVGHGLDGTTDELDDDASQDDPELFKAVAIPTDPNDPRIEACQSWTLDKLKLEFQKEQLDWRGLRMDPEKRRIKFRKHFELERDYSIYRDGRLRQAIKDRGIRMKYGADRVDKADKAELVDALTDYDARQLDGEEFSEGYVDLDTRSSAYMSEPYESNEASGTEVYYVALERGDLTGKKKPVPPPDPSLFAPAPVSSHKRTRNGDDKYDDESEDTRNPVRTRVRC